MMKKLLKVVLLAGALSLSFSAVADFVPGMTADQVEAEVVLRLGRNESLETIGAAAAAAGVSPGLLALALTSHGQNTVAVVAAVSKTYIAAGTAAGDVAGAVVAAVVGTIADKNSPEVGNVVAAALNAGKVDGVVSDAFLTSVVTAASSAGATTGSLVAGAALASVDVGRVTAATGAGGTTGAGAAGTTGTTTQGTTTSGGGSSGQSPS